MYLSETYSNTVRHVINNNIKQQYTSVIATTKPIMFRTDYLSHGIDLGINHASRVHLQQGADKTHHAKEVGFNVPQMTELQSFDTY